MLYSIACTLFVSSNVRYIVSINLKVYNFFFIVYNMIYDYYYDIPCCILYNVSQTTIKPDKIILYHDTHALLINQARGERSLKSS